MRPVNAAVAPTYGQTGRKEAAGINKLIFGDTPNPGKGLRPLHSCGKNGIGEHLESW
jgi:hypothetical protein